MLNLKGIRFKVFSEEPQTLTFSKKGKGEVKAKDLQLNADVEVVNPDHVIATVDDDKTSFNMELL
jgi:DNA-directed RNA polymerase subunit alpha